MAGTLQTVIISSPPQVRTLSLRFLDRYHRFSSKSCTHFRCRIDYLKQVRASKPDPNPENESNAKEHTSFSWGKPIFRFAERNFLALALGSGLVLGLVNPSLGCLADKYSVSKIGPFGIFVISGLTLRGREIGAAAKAWTVGLFGLVSILFLTPYFSKLIMLIQLQPQEFVTGLAVFCCMPTTLSSGVALTQLAGGNTALALALTVVSNLMGIFLVPFSISKYVANGMGLTLPTKQLFRSLVTTILIPLILGKVLRESLRGVANFVDQNRGLLSKINAIFLSLVPWIQVSRSRSLLLMVKPWAFLVAIALGMYVLFIFIPVHDVAKRLFVYCLNSSILCILLFMLYHITRSKPLIRRYFAIIHFTSNSR